MTACSSSIAFSTFNKVLVLAGAALALILSLDWNEKQGIARFEFPVLMLFSVVGMMIMTSAANLMTLYMGLELQSLALYVLAAFARDDIRSSEAGLKYFVLSGLASGLLLYGISLVYGFSGTMDFAHLRVLLVDPAHASTGLVVGIVFVLVGLAFKVSAVPFHMWTPDVYEGAPTPVTVFFATAPKVAAMSLFLRVMMISFGHLLGAWQDLIVIVSAASMLLGRAGGDRPDQHQAADGVFLDRPHGLRADRPGRRHAGRHPRRADLHAGLCVHDRRHLRLHHRHAPPRPSGGADQRSGGAVEHRSGAGAGASRCSCSAWRASPCSPGSSPSSTSSWRRCRPGCGAWRCSAC